MPSSAPTTANPSLTVALLGHVVFRRISPQQPYLRRSSMVCSLLLTRIGKIRGDFHRRAKCVSGNACAMLTVSLKLLRPVAYNAVLSIAI